MATRIKTIEYAIQSTGSTLAAATMKEFTGNTSIYIPETGGTFAFKSVILQVQVGEDDGTPATMTAPTVAFRTGNSAFSSTVLVNPVANSGEEQEWTITSDITAAMASQWTGSTMPWYVRTTFTGVVTSSHSIKIIITYQYDDTAATDRQIKTVRIPIESTRTLLTTSWQTIGGVRAIPAIAGSYFPESGITIRQAFLEIWGNAGTNATTNFAMMIRTNGVLQREIWRTLGAPNSAQWAKGISDITGQAALTGTTVLEALVTTTTSRWCTIGGMIVVTYEFNTTTSTGIYNSLMLGAVDTSGSIGATTATDQTVWDRNIYIEEPNPLTLKESGLALWQNDSGGYIFNVRVSGDTAAQSGYTQYTMTAGAVQCGAYSLVHRIDTGGQYGPVGGGGMSIKRGKNLYRVLCFSNTTQAGWNLSGFLLLNYVSGKHSSGVGVHAHTVYQHVTDNVTSTGARVTTSGTITPTIPETNYYLIGLLFWINYSPIGNGATGPLDIDFTLNAEVVSTDPMSGGDGWVDIYDGTARSDSENANGYNYAAVRTSFTRWAGDPDPDRMNFLTGRKYRLDTGPLWTGSLGYWYTYNNITYTVSGTCTGYSGNGANIPIDIYRVVSTTSDEVILNLMTTTGGTFTGTWIDNTDTLYAAAYQDTTHAGRSINGVAG